MLLRRREMANDMQELTRKVLVNEEVLQRGGPVGRISDRGLETEERRKIQEEGQLRQTGAARAGGAFGRSTIWNASIAARLGAVGQASPA